MIEFFFINHTNTVKNTIIVIVRNSMVQRFAFQALAGWGGSGFDSQFTIQGLLVCCWYCLDVLGTTQEKSNTLVNIVKELKPSKRYGCGGITLHYIIIKIFIEQFISDKNKGLPSKFVNINRYQKPLISVHVILTLILLIIITLIHAHVYDKQFFYLNLYFEFFTKIVLVLLFIIGIRLVYQAFK